MKLIFPSLSIIVAPFNSGKTNLIKDLIFNSASEIHGVILISNTGVTSYELNYQFLNPKYIYDYFDEDLLLIEIY